MPEIDVNQNISVRTTKQHKAFISYDLWTVNSQQNLID